MFLLALNLIPLGQRFENVWVMDFPFRELFPRLCCWPLIQIFLGYFQNQTFSYSIHSCIDDDVKYLWSVKGECSNRKFLSMAMLSISNSGSWEHTNNMRPTKFKISDVMFWVVLLGFYWTVSGLILVVLNDLLIRPGRLQHSLFHVWMLDFSCSVVLFYGSVVLLNHL